MNYLSNRLTALPRWLVAVLVVLLASAQPGRAQTSTLYWDGVSGSWNNPTNWSIASGATTPDPISVPGAWENAVFNITGANSAETITLDADQSAKALAFNNTGATTLTGGGTDRTLRLGTGGLTLASGAGPVTFGNGTAGNNVLLSLPSGAQTWANNSASAAFTLGDTTVSAVSRATGATVDFQSAGGSFNLSTTHLPNVNSIIGPWAFYGTGTSMKYAYNNAGTIAAFPSTGASYLSSCNNANVNYTCGDTSSRAQNGNYGGNTFIYTGSPGGYMETYDMTSTTTAYTYTFNGILAVSAPVSGNPITLNFQNSGHLGHVAIGSANELVIAGQANVLFNAMPITGASGALTYSGSGTLTMNAANTYGGGTTVNGGTVTVNGSGTLGSTSGPLTVNGGTLQMDHNQTVGNLTGLGGTIQAAAGSPTLTIGSGDSTGGNYQGGIANGGGTLALAKTGAGVITLSGTNTYAGATTINGGTLRVTTGSGTKCASALTVANAAGCIFGVQLAAANDQWSSSSDLTLAGGSSEVDIDYGSTTPSTSTDPVKVANLNVSGGGKLKLLLNNISQVTPGTYPLINFTGTGPATAAPYTGLTLSAAPGVTAYLTVTAHHVNLVVTAISAILSWNTGDGMWTSGTPWDNGSGAVDFTPGDVVTLGDDAGVSGDPTLTVESPVSPGWVTMNSANHSYTLTGSFITGTGGLTVNSTGGRSLTLSNPNNAYSGDTLISAGTLKLGAAGVIPDGAAKGNVTVNGTLDLNGYSETINGLSEAGTVDNTAAGTATLTVGNNDQTSTFSGTLRNTAGTLALTKTGAGVLTLSGANTYSGATTVNGGTLALSRPTLSANSTVTVATNAVLHLDFAGTNVVLNLVLNGVIQAPGSYSSANASPFLAGTGTVLVQNTVDSDGDGIPDWWMLKYFGHATGQTNDQSLAQNDPDGDGLSNLQEYQAGTNPLNPDTDGDGLSDGQEVLTYHTNPLNPDTDGDGLTDYQEVMTYHTNPLNPDSDGDGVTDWYEVMASYTDPNNANSRPPIPYPLPKPDGQAGATNKPVKVFILAGQSNMVGMGDVNPLGTPGTLATVVQSQGKFPNLLNTNGGWAVRNDVYYRGVISAPGNGPLTVGQGATSGNLGPELGFGQVMGYYFDEPVLLIKASQGNRSLFWDILPPGSPPYTNGSTVYAGYGQGPNSWPVGGGPSPYIWYAGKQYDDFFLANNDMGAPAWTSGVGYGGAYQVKDHGVTYICTATNLSSAATEPGVGASWTSYWQVYSIENVTTVLDNFAAQYPQWAAQGFQIAGFVWFQGNADIQSTLYANRYETNLVQLIKQVRAYYANRYPGKCSTNTPFVLATGCGDPQTSGNGLIVANAQLAMTNAVKYPAFAGNVKTMDTRGYWRDATVSPNPSQPYHYYHNAETYLLTGDALGRGMLSLYSGTDTNPPVLTALSPADNATNGVINAPLTATFNKTITIGGTGNITLKNLTDGTQTLIPVTNAAQVSVSGTTLTIVPASGLLNGKQYAVRIDATAISDLVGNYFAGITDDTTWNFSTAHDPLLDAASELTAYINALTNLSAAQIGADSQVLTTQTSRFAQNSNTIATLFNLVRAFDASAYGPLWVRTGSLTRSSDTTNLTWTIYHTMQGIMDTIYTSTNLAQYSSLLNGFQFGSSANFPGACSAPPTSQTYTVAVNASFPDTFGRDTFGWTLPARRPTGAYLAPGTLVTVTVPPALVNSGYQIRVGAHSWDFSNKPTVARLDRSSLLYPITSTNTLVASPLGGGIYLEVPLGANAGVTNLTIIGAARSPFFQATSFHQTTSSQWLTERTNVGPWADFQSDKFLMQVPRSWIYNFSNPITLLSNWDLAMDAVNDLMGFPHLRGKDTFYLQVDLLLRASVYAPGYPAVNDTYNPNTSYGGNYTSSYLLSGPQYSPQYVFHEQGHGFLFPKFSGETESTVNLLYVPVLTRKFGVSLDDAFRASYSYVGNNVASNLDNTAVLWMTTFDFSPRQIDMQSGEKSYQPQGHAKYADIARLYGESGWAGLGNFWSYYNSNDTYGVSYPTDDDSLLIQLCKSVGKDLRPLWHFWGVMPNNPANVAAQVAAAGLRPPPEIRDLLLHYKSLLPTNNASYQAWCLKWYGHQPSTNGYLVEWYHARQWSTNLLNSPDPLFRTPTEIYDEAAYGQVSAQAQAIIDLYYPPGSAYLTNLTLSAGTLSPTFASNVFSYAASVPNTVTSLSLTPMASAGTSASIMVNGAPVVSGAASAPFSLAVGSNTLATVVVSPDFTATNTYTVTVTRAALIPPVLTGFGPLSGTSCPLTFSGPSGQTYSVLSSTNVALPLSAWKLLTSGTFGTSPVTYTDTSATNAQQFYRITSP